MRRQALHLQRLELRRLPGFEEGGFALTDLSPGVNLIHGPNGAGKTSTARAIRLLLWPAGEGASSHSLLAEAALGDQRWSLELDHGRVRRLRDGRPTEGPALPPEEEADRYGLALHDLLGAESGDRFAAQLRREMAGGYDLRRAAEGAGARSTPSRPRKSVERLRRALRRVGDLQAEQRALEGEALRLDRLRAELGRAREARHELAGVDAALAWHEQQGALHEAEATLAELPAAVESCRGNEIERSEELSKAMKASRRDLREVHEALAGARARFADAGLPAEGVPAELLPRLRQRCDRLYAVEERVAAAEKALRSARERRAETRRALGLEVSDELLRGLDAAAWRELGELERKESILRGEQLQIADLERWLGGVREEVDSEILRRTVNLLRQRLRLGEAPVGWPAWRRQLPVLAGALALAAVGVFGALRVAPGLWLLVGAAAGLVIWAWLEAGRDEQAQRRRLLDKELDPYLDPGSPERRSPDDLARRLDELEARLAGAVLEGLKAERSRELQLAAGALSQRVAELERERGSLVERIGLAPRMVAELEPAPLAALVQRMAEWQRADVEARGLEAEILEERGRRDGLLVELAADLTPFGLAPPADHAEARGAADALAARVDAAARARAELDRLEGEDGAVARVERSLADLQTARRRLFTDLGVEVGDQEELRRLLALRPRWEETHRAREVARQLQREMLGRLGDERDLLELSSDELRRRRDRLEELAGRHDELLGEIRAVETRVGEARRETQLEEALAERRAARDALAEQRDRDREALVTDLLAEWLQARGRTRSEPATLRRAAELFARITRGRCRLVAPRGEPPEFAARESAGGRIRSLGELSSGTRLQLLVAVRMAFVESQERGAMLPLVLDETLANSDDWAASAVIESVVELAAEGRQVFYLTAQQDEVAKWLHVLDRHPDLAPRVIDLGRVRFADRAVRRPRRVAREARRPVPPAGGMSRHQYGEAIDAPGIDPWSDVGSVHLWHLVEEPRVLERLLAAGVERWNALKALVAEGAAQGLLGGGREGERRCRRVEARARSLEALLGAWRQGRGRRVTAMSLRDSGAVSATFIDRVTELAAGLGGDSERLIAALRDRQIPRFLTQKIDDLERFLLEEGYLDERPVLGGEELRRRALVTGAPDVEAGLLTADDLDELLAQLPEVD